MKVGNRLGDNAEMCIIELVDYNENMLSTAKKEVSKKRRSRKKSDGAVAETPKKESATPKTETVIAETPEVEGTTAETAE